MEHERTAYRLSAVWRRIWTFGSVDGRNDGECLPIRLAAKIPATKVVEHKGASQKNLEDIIPI